MGTIRHLARGLYDDPVQNPRTLKLLPGDERVAELKRDYQAMQPMIFKEAPDFETIVATLRELELQINSIQYINRTEQ